MTEESETWHQLGSLLNRIAGPILRPGPQKGKRDPGSVGVAPALGSASKDLRGENPSLASMSWQIRQMFETASRNGIASHGSA